MRPGIGQNASYTVGDFAYTTLLHVYHLIAITGQTFGQGIQLLYTAIKSSDHEEE